PRDRPARSRANRPGWGRSSAPGGAFRVGRRRRAARPHVAGGPGARAPAHGRSCERSPHPRTPAGGSVMTVRLAVSATTEQAAALTENGPRRDFIELANRTNAEVLFQSRAAGRGGLARSEEHTSELQSRENLVCRLLL